MKLWMTSLLAVTLCSTSFAVAGSSIHERGERDSVSSSSAQKIDPSEVSAQEWRERSNREPGAAHARPKASVRTRALIQTMNLGAKLVDPPASDLARHPIRADH